MAVTFEDVNPVADAITWLAAHPRIVAEFPAGAVTGEARDPWPHLRVTPTAGGFLHDGTHQHTDEVQIEVIDHPGGVLGMAGLRRLLLIAAAAVHDLDDRDSLPGDTVITEVRSTSGAVWSPLPGGQGRFLTTFSITAHPGLP